MERGRRIAFDYGDTRIGVAVCDPDGILATPLPFLDTRHPKLKQHLNEILREYQPVKIYLGAPIHLSGEVSESLVKANDFQRVLSELTDVPISLIDERLSTVEASRRLKEAGRDSRQSRSLIDSMAAVSILERGLASDC